MGSFSTPAPGKASEAPRERVARWRALLTTVAGRDLALMLIVAALSSVTAIALDLNERLVGYAFRHPEFERFGLDDLPFAFAIVSLGAAWFAYRRWREYRAESSAHRKTMAQLRLAMDEAVAANQGKAQFLATMSHELRTPLNAILGFSEVIKSQTLGPAAAAKYREYADDIHVSGTLLLSIVNDILDMARVEAGALHFELETVDVAETLTRVRRLIGARAFEGGLQIEMTAEEGLAAWADCAKFRQALLNLAFNAVKFTPRGGRIHLRARRDGQFVCVEVMDTGIGMAKNDIPKALMPFQQIDNSLRRRFEGTGLGLPLSKRFIEKQGGSLEIESEPGIGTTAIVRMPLSRRSAQLAG